MGTQNAFFVLAGVGRQCAERWCRTGLVLTEVHVIGVVGADLQSGTGSGDVCAVLAGDDGHCVDMLAALETK